MFESSLQLGRIAGIRIGIHYTWLIVFALMTSSLYFSFHQEMVQWNEVVALITAVFTSVVFFISIIMHELGHSIVAIRNGINVRSITLFIFGGVAQIEKEANSAMVEFKIAIAGPAVSFVLAIAFLVLRNILSSPGAPLYIAFDQLSMINFLVAIFNLVPGFPLDGGRVFRAIVWGFTGNEAKGMRVAVAGGRIVAYGLMAWGLYVGYLTGSLINGIWYVGIGWFLLSAAVSSGRAFDQNRIFSHLTIRGLMDTNVPRVKGSLSIRDWVSGNVLPGLKRAALVERDNSIIGLASLSDARKIPEEEWQGHNIEEIMTPMQKLKWVHIDDLPETVVKIMQQFGVNQVPVVEGKTVVGWIDQEKIGHAISVFTEAGQ